MAGVITRRALPRRLFLRAAGATIALPWLDAMAPALAATPAGPARLGFFYVPNGMAMPGWRVEGGSPGDLPPTLMPLAGIRSQVTVVSGLAQLTARRTDGMGPHARAAAAWLSGMPLVTAESGAPRGAVTADQLAARTLGRHTPLPSLELAVEAVDPLEARDRGPASARRTIAWRGPDAPLPMLGDPRTVFTTLFGRAPEERPSASVLDTLRAQAAALAGTLGPADRAVLDDYLSEVRGIETRLTPAQQARATARLEAGEPGDAAVDPDAHADQLFDLLYLAYRADVTRVATLMLAFEASERAYVVDGVSVAHHAVSHHGGDPVRLRQLAAINRHHVAHFARFCERLRQTPEGDATLLDRAVFLFGAGLGDPHDHRVEDLPLAVVGGGNGTLEGNRHLSYGGATPMANLVLALLAKAGVRVDRLGDSTGLLAGL